VSASKVRQLVPVTLDASGSTGQGSQIATYQFTCDRQQPQPASSSPTATCTFRRMGAHAVQVVVTNTAGKTATATKTVTVLEGQPPAAQLTLSSKYLQVGQRVKADASKSSGSKVSPIVAYRFQCGTQQRTKWGTKATTGCTFRHTGWHTITVWVKNTLGQVSERSRLVHVSK
jgi:carbohydrate-binding DOMON domain-containing protein